MQRERELDLCMKTVGRHYQLHFLNTLSCKQSYSIFFLYTPSSLHPNPQISIEIQISMPDEMMQSFSVWFLHTTIQRVEVNVEKEDRIEQ